MTQKQVQYLMTHLPLIEMRRHLPTAQLEAAVRNMMGGKPDGESKTVLSADKIYSASELLPPYAVPDYILNAITKETALDIIKNIKNVPMWAINVIDLRQIERVAHG